jgi:hypothetical protein
MSGGFGMSDGTGGGSFAGGSDPQTVEVIKTFMERCPAVVVTQDKTKANYVVLFDREGGKRGTSGWSALLRKVDKIALFRADGDALFSGSVRSVCSAVKDACTAVQKDAESHLGSGTNR